LRFSAELSAINDAKVKVVLATSLVKTIAALTVSATSLETTIVALVVSATSLVETTVAQKV